MTTRTLQQMYIDFNLLKFENNYLHYSLQEHYRNKFVISVNEKQERIESIRSRLDVLKKELEELDRDITLEEESYGIYYDYYSDDDY